MADKTGYIGRNPGDSSVTIARQTFTPTSNTTEFSFTSGYTVGLCDVYLNGVKLVDTRDYEANTGSTVGLTSEAVSGDIVEIIAYKAFNLGNVTSASGNFTVSGNTTLSGTVSVGSTATLSGVTTCEGDLYVGGDLYVLDDIVYDEVTGRNLNITGIATAAVIHAGAGATVLSSGNAEFVGIVTSNTCFKVGNGAFGAGIGATITGDGNAVFAGVVTATTFKGDGSALTGVAATDNINTNNIQVSGISTLGTASASSVAVGAALAGNNLLQLTGGVDSAFVRLKKSNASGAGVAYGGLNVFDNGNVGIASVVAHNEGSGTAAYLSLYTYNSGAIGERLRVQGDGISVTGISSATGSLHVGTTITADAGTGIVTATSYKGDGSSLTGVGGEFDITSCLFI